MNDAYAILGLYAGDVAAPTNIARNLQ